MWRGCGSGRRFGRSRSKVTSSRSAVRPQAEPEHPAPEEREVEGKQPKRNGREDHLDRQDCAGNPVVQAGPDLHVDHLVERLDIEPRCARFRLSSSACPASPQSRALQRVPVGDRASRPRRRGCVRQANAGVRVPHQKSSDRVRIGSRSVCPAGYVVPMALASSTTAARRDSYRPAPAPGRTRAQARRGRAARPAGSRTARGGAPTGDAAIAEDEPDSGVPKWPRTGRGRARDY